MQHSELSIRTRIVAFTLVEMVLVVSLASLLLMMVYEFWQTTARMTSVHDARSGALAQAGLALDSVIHEIERSRRLVYPAPGGAPQPGVGIVDPMGNAVMFTLNSAEAPRAGEQPKPSDLARFEWKSRTSRVLLRGAVDFRCRVPAVPPGRSPDLVHLTLTFSGPDGRPLMLATSVRIRPLSITCPLSRH